MTFGDDEEIGVLPAKVRDWAELQECIPNLPFVPKDLFEPQCETNTLEELEHYNYLESLAGANDAGITFPQIADLIKAFV
jgi:hypothetical protein